MIRASASPLGRRSLRDSRDSKCQSWGLSPSLSDSAKSSALGKAESMLVCEEFRPCITTLGMETEPAWEGSEETACLVAGPPKVKREALAACSVAPSFLRHGSWRTQAPGGGNDCPTSQVQVHRTCWQKGYTHSEECVVHTHTCTPLSSQHPKLPLACYPS